MARRASGMRRADEVWRYWVVTQRRCGAAFSPDGRLIVTASFDGTARVWSADVAPVTELRDHSGAVTSVALSPDGKFLVTASLDKTARVWQTSGNAVRELRGHGGGVLSAAFSPNGKLIVTASLDKTARVWDALTGEVVTTLGHDAAVDAASFSPDDRLIATKRGEDRTEGIDCAHAHLSILSAHSSASEEWLERLREPALPLPSLSEDLYARTGPTRL